MSQRPCLYCGDPDRPHTSEHVLQHGFGANMTLTEDVCGDCNTRIFSPLDDELLGFVRSLAYWDHPDVPHKRPFIHNHSLQFDEKNQVWLSVRIDRSFRPITLPQLVLLGGNRIACFMDQKQDSDWRARVNQMRDELGRGDMLALKRVITSGKHRGTDLPVQTALVRSGKNSYFIRARDEERAARLEALVRSNKLGDAFSVQGEARHESSREWIHQDVEIDAGAIERAITKTALNFVCKVLGPDVARSAAFDPARNFARLPYTKPRNGFVSFTFGKDADPGFKALCEGFVRPGHHSLVLTEVAEAGVLVILVLYQRPFAVVRLAEPRRGRLHLPEGSIVAGLFDYGKPPSHEVHHFLTDPVGFFKLFIAPVALRHAGDDEDG